MSVQPILDSLEKLIDLHDLLLDVSKQKTEVVKEGSVEKLQKILAKEHKLIRTLEQTEQKRREAVEKWFLRHEIPEETERTITNMLELVPEPENKKLGELTVSLTMAITELKQQEQLNRALINQSMNFIQMSLNILNPTINNMNYGKNVGVKPINRSVFDSQA